MIVAKLENALALDYPADRLEIVVTSDDSTDATHDSWSRFADRGVRLIHCARGGKVAAQDRAVAETSGEIVAFGDANVLVGAGRAAPAGAAVRRPRRGHGVRQRPPGQPGRRHQPGGALLALRDVAAHARVAAHSMTGSNGAIYAVRREAYRDVDPRFGHDLSFPYLMVQNGYRAVYEPSAGATEPMTTDIEDEFRRKVRMFEHCWLILFRGRMFGLRKLGPVYWVEIVSHRLLRYWSGPLHLVLLVTSAALAPTQRSTPRPGGAAGGARARGRVDAPARPRPRAADPALLPAGDARDGDRARRLPAPRRPRHLGQGGGVADP